VAVLPDPGEHAVGGGQRDEGLSRRISFWKTAQCSVGSSWCRNERAPADSLFSFTGIQLSVSSSKIVMIYDDEVLLLKYTGAICVAGE